MATLRDIARLSDGPAKRQLLAAVNGKPRSKYGNVRTAYAGRTFDSKAEAARAQSLDLMKRGGVIFNFYCQPSIELEPGVRYRPDFLIAKEPGLIWCEDVKGALAPRFKVIAQLWALHGPCELRLLKYKGGTFECFKSINPEQP